MEQDLDLLKQNFKKHESNFYSFRVKQLEALRTTLKNNLEEYKQAAFADLGWTSEMTQGEIDSILINIQNSIN